MSNSPNEKLKKNVAVLNLLADLRKRRAAIEPDERRQELAKEEEVKKREEEKKKKEEEGKERERKRRSKAAKKGQRTRVMNKAVEAGEEKKKAQQAQVNTAIPPRAELVWLPQIPDLSDIAHRALLALPPMSRAQFTAPRPRLASKPLRDPFQLRRSLQRRNLEWRRSPRRRKLKWSRLSKPR